MSDRTGESYCVTCNELVEGDHAIVTRHQVIHVSIFPAYRELNERLTEHVRINNELNNELAPLRNHVKCNEIIGNLARDNADLEEQNSRLHKAIEIKDKTIEGYVQGIKEHLNKSYGREAQCGDTVFNSLYLRHHTCTRAKGHTGLHSNENVQW